MSLATGNVGAGPVRPGFELPLERLTPWLAANVPGVNRVLEVAQFHGGQSNPTYHVKTDAGPLVLRRKPPGSLLPGAHAVEREAQVMKALGSTGFPVPTVYGLCDDAAVVGTPFFVMAHVEGRIVWDAGLPTLAKEERAAYFDAMNATIARLHQVDVTAAGLGSYGKPGSYFARQIKRWSEQYLKDEAGGRDPDLDVLVRELPSRIPPNDETALIHGDFRIDNVVFDPDGPTVRAVLDWELSTLGHPLSDFAYHAMMYRLPGDIIAGLKGVDVRAIGVPSEAEYVAAYCARTGRPSIPHWEFYVAFNLFRFAAIIHGVKARVARGNASSAQAADRVAHLSTVTRMARESLEVSG